MESFTSEDARRDWRRILDRVQRGEQIGITRYGDPLAVITSDEWHEIALAVHGAVNAVTHDADGNRLPDDTTLTVGDLYSAIGEAAISELEQQP